MIKDIILITLERKQSIFRYIEPSSVSYVEHMIDGFETGELRLQAIRPDALDGLDMSRPLPIYSRIDIILTDDSVIQTYVAEDVVSRLSIGLDVYEHDIKLVEPIKIATRINIPALSITQPKSDGFINERNMVAGDFTLNTTNIFRGNAQSELIYGGSGQNIDRYNFLNSGNQYKNPNTKTTGTIIHGNVNTITLDPNLPDVLADGEEKQAVIDLRFLNPQFNHKLEQSDQPLIGRTTLMATHLFYNADTTVNIRLKIDNEVIASENHTIPASSMVSPEQYYKTRYGNKRYRAGTGDYVAFATNGPSKTTISFKRGTKAGVVNGYNVGNVDVNGLSFVLDGGQSTFRFSKTIPGDKSGKVTVEIYKANTKWNYMIKSATTNSGDFGYTERSKDILITGGSLKVYSNGQSEEIYGKTLDTEVKKILKMSDRHKLFLDPASEAILQLYRAPEYTYDNNNIYEILKEIGAYIGAIPKIEIIEQYSTRWNTATESEYNNGTNKIIVKSTSEDFLNILNDVHNEAPVGYVARRIGTGSGNMYAKTVSTGDKIEVKKVYFKFFNDIEQGIVMELENTQADVISRDNENYVSAIELNTDNLISESKIVDTGWIKINGTDTSGNNKITQDNIGIKLPHGPIYGMKQVEMNTPFNITLTDPDGIKPNKVIYKNTIIDISEYVLEEAYYNTLINVSNYTFEERLTMRTKNQHIYYKQGDGMIYGLGHVGTHEPITTMLADVSANRALYEIIAKKLTDEYGLQPPRLMDTANLTGDLSVLFRFKYIPYTSARTNVYKDDQSGFLEHTTKYYNEQQKVNDTSALGRKAQLEVNKMGNTEEEINGSTRYHHKVPKLGTLNRPNGRTLVAIQRHFHPERIDYIGKYVKDYTIVNKDFGVVSEYRQYEIPKEDTVRRIDTREIHAYISENKQYISTIDGVQVSDLFGSLHTAGGKKSMKPYFARIRTYRNNGDEIIDVIKPIQSDIIGKGIIHRFDFDDNYSAGSIIRSRQYEYKPNLFETQYYQEDLEYSDRFGSINMISIDYLGIENGYFDTTTNSIYSYVDYPLWDGSSYQSKRMFKVSNHRYLVNKDAREAYSFSHDIKFLTDTSNIQIYDAMAKYNLYTDNTGDIRIGSFKGKISKNLHLLNDIDITTSPNNNMSVHSNHITYSVNTVGDIDGIVVYNNDTLEPLIVYYTKNKTGTLYIGLADFRMDIKIKGVESTAEPILRGIYSEQVGNSEWAIGMWVENTDTSPVELFIDDIGNNFIQPSISNRPREWFNLSLTDTNPEGKSMTVSLQAKAEGKEYSNKITETHRIYDYWNPHPGEYYDVTFKRAWNNTTIKVQTVKSGTNATFPTTSQIGYGLGYEYSYYTGSYSNVQGDVTIMIYRKATNNARWVQYRETVNSNNIPPKSPGIAVAGGVCTSVGSRHNTGLGMMVDVGNTVEHLYYICELD